MLAELIAGKPLFPFREIDDQKYGGYGYVYDFRLLRQHSLA